MWKGDLLIARLPLIAAASGVASGAASGLAGCTECGPWDELLIDASAMPADSEGELEEADYTLQNFINWTGREETCVQEVVFNAALPEGEAVSYKAGSQRVFIADGAGPTRLVHGLCHALDHEAGWASDEAAELLAPLALHVDRDRFPSHKARTREAFARLCAEGPEVTVVEDSFDRLCGTDALHPGRQFMLDLAYPGASALPDEALLTGRFALTQQDLDLPETRSRYEPSGASLAVGAEGLFVLSHEYVYDLDGDYILPTLFYADTEGELVERLALAPQAPATIDGLTYRDAHALLSASTAPILFAFRGEEAGQAWRVLTDPLRLEPMGAVALPAYTRWRGFEHEGVLMVQGDALELPLRLDLQGGEPSPLPVDFVEPAHGPPYTFSFDAGGAVAAIFTEEGWTLADLDPQGEARWSAPLPLGPDELAAVFRGPEGGLFAQVALFAHAPGYGFHVRRSTLRFDPALERWSLPDEDCGDTQVSGGLVAGDRVWSLLYDVQNEDFGLGLRALEVTEL